MDAVGFYDCYFIVLVFTRYYLPTQGKLKEFQVGDLVWEAVLPLGTKDASYGKCSPNWHGPYRIDQVLPRNAYMLEELDVVKFPIAVNGQHLKKYFPNMWDDR
jgi:hypothetical protein